MTLTRRTMLQALAAAGVGALAGCLGAAETMDCTELPTEPRYRGWFDGVQNYHGTCDSRDRETVTVMVGTDGNNGGQWGFDPAAIAVTPGTTVRWEWTGRGGAHDVRSESELFASGDPVDDAGTTFEFTFDEPGVYRYYCTPHREMGMKGAVFVALE